MGTLRATPARRPFRVAHAPDALRTVPAGTIANLTLMALGSSAPEILLSIIEIVSSGFYSGELGPSTIVGSAAFNLLGISAVCVLAIPVGQSRFVKERMVFACTAFFSVFAYAWLYYILIIVSPNIVEVAHRAMRSHTRACMCAPSSLPTPCTPATCSHSRPLARQVWEGMATLFLFPLLVLLAYMADLHLCDCTTGQSAMLDVNKYGKGVSRNDVRMRPTPVPTNFLSPLLPSLPPLRPPCTCTYARSCRGQVVLALKNSGYENVDLAKVDPSVLSSALSYALAPTSRAFYRVNATRKHRTHHQPAPCSLACSVVLLPRLGVAPAVLPLTCRA